MNENLISKSIRLVGAPSLARLLGVTKQAIWKWRNQGRLPRTEWTGETNYAAMIEKATNGAVTRDDLLDFPKKGES